MRAPQFLQTKWRWLHLADGHISGFASAADTADTAALYRTASRDRSNGDGIIGVKGIGETVLIGVHSVGEDFWLAGRPLGDVRVHNPMNGIVTI
jgi:hypothetical protein